MRRDIQFGVAGGLLVSLLSWNGNTAYHFVSIFPNGATFVGMIAFFFGVARVQRQNMGSSDFATAIRRMLPVGVVSGLVTAATMVLLGLAHFSHYGWMLVGFAGTGAFMSCFLWAILVATASWWLAEGHMKLFAMIFVGLLVTATVASAQDSKAYPPGNGVSTPKLIKEVKPNYTPEARAAKIQGTVLLSAVVLEDGSVGAVTVARSLDTKYGLDAEAIKAAKQWTFSPGMKDGKPVAVKVTIELAFTLPGR